MRRIDAFKWVGVGKILRDYRGTTIRGEVFVEKNPHEKIIEVRTSDKIQKLY